ncbi:hypothetical protein [Moorena sp. SIOASIH]|uniref:hypothetical protein n=1 Tax=Moorena sp. SIOASIH TaxID=2607817 RepID=UPI0025EBF4D3|nr:hypothetical protein [Moorena sp. SIOASIH]
MNFDVTDIRIMTQRLAPTADFDSSFTFYYDETTNCRKFYVKEFDFNHSFKSNKSNFILGGLVHEGSQPNIEPLFDRLQLQNNITEVKFKNIAHGQFIDCLKSQKLNCFLKYLLENDLYIHYSSINFLYWSIVDIVDSAIANSEVAMHNYLLINNRKNDLYKVAKIEIDSVI